MPTPPLRQVRSSRQNLDMSKRFFLLYLNQKTWLGAAGSKLAEQVPHISRISATLQLPFRAHPATATQHPDVPHLTPLQHPAAAPLQPPCANAHPATAHPAAACRTLHTEQVRTARAADIRVILAHECDPARGGCEFGTLFQTTPQDLIAGGLYARIAVAFHTGQHRAVSLCLFARELGAVRYRIKDAFKSRGDVDAAKLHTGLSQVFSRSAGGTTLRATPRVEAEHLARATSCLEGAFEDPPDNEGTSPAEGGGSRRPSLAQGQLVASGNLCIS